MVAARVGWGRVLSIASLIVDRQCLYFINETNRVAPSGRQRDGAGSTADSLIVYSFPNQIYVFFSLPAFMGYKMFQVDLLTASSSFTGGVINM